MQWLLLIILFSWKELTHLSGNGSWKRWGIGVGSPHAHHSKKRWRHLLGLYHQRLQPTYQIKGLSSFKSSLVYCTGGTVGTSLTNLNITMHLNWIMSPGKSVSLLHPLASLNIIDCLWELTNSMTLPKKSRRLLYLTFLIVRFTWMIGNFSHSWETPLQVLEQVLQRLPANKLHCSSSQM